MLALFLLPGEWIMSRLRFVQKFLLVAALILVPVSYLSYQNTVELSHAITIPYKQLVGAQFVRESGNLMKEVQKHRGTASRLLNGDAAAGSSLLDFQANAEKAIASLDDLDDKHGGILHTTEGWQQIKTDWSTLTTALNTMTTAQSFEAHTTLVSRIQAFIGHVADASALTMNSVLAEYHLSNLTTQILPVLSEGLGRQRAAGAGVATRRQATPAEQIQLHVLTSAVQSGFARAEVSLAQTYRNDPLLRALLEQQAKEMNDLVIKYQQIVQNDLLAQQVITIDGKWYFDEATSAIDSVFTLQDLAIDVLNERLSNRVESLSERRVLALSVTGISLLLMAYAMLVFSLSARRGLRMLELASLRMMQGDFQIERLEAGSRDEIGQVSTAFNMTVEHLRSLIQGVTSSAATLQTASESLRDTSRTAVQGTEGATQSVEQVALGANEQAQAADEVRHTMQGLQETIHQIARGSDEVSAQVQNASRELEQLATSMDGVAVTVRRVSVNTDQAASSARNGVEVVKQTTAGMERVRQVVSNSAQQMRHLEQVSAQIGEITLMISEIAEQTNLLALNAAIEAARAGEHGRGFAVVASEVRRLAERSARSAKDISTLVQSIQVRMVEAAKAMDVGAAEAETGAHLAAESGRVLAEILTTIHQAATEAQAISGVVNQMHDNVREGARGFEAVAAVTEENAAASEEMAAGAGVVMTAIERVAAVAQQNAEAGSLVLASVRDLNALSHHVASSSQLLAGVACELQQQVSRIKA